MNSIACASLEVLLGALLLHDADMVYHVSCHDAEASSSSSSPIDDMVFHLRQLCAAVCFAAAAIRTAIPPEARRCVEEAAMFVSFAIAMVTRAAAGCGGETTVDEEPHRQCCPEAIAAMVTTLLLCSACASWCTCMGSSRTHHTHIVVGKQGDRSLI